MTMHQGEVKFKKIVFNNQEYEIMNLFESSSNLEYKIEGLQLWIRDLGSEWKKAEVFSQEMPLYVYNEEFLPLLKFKKGILINEKTVSRKKIVDKMILYVYKQMSVQRKKNHLNDEMPFSADQVK